VYTTPAAEGASMSEGRLSEKPEEKARDETNHADKKTAFTRGRSNPIIRPGRISLKEAS